MAASRPGGVTLVSILAWISGITQVILGIILALGGPNSNVLTIAGWIAGILGLITILVAAGLWRGIAVARVFATVVYVLNFANAVFALFNATAATAWGFVGTALIAVLGLVLLWTKQASDFFRS